MRGSGVFAVVLFHYAEPVIAAHLYGQFGQTGIIYAAPHLAVKCVDCGLAQWGSDRYRLRSGAGPRCQTADP